MKLKLLIGTGKLYSIITVGVLMYYLTNIKEELS